MRGSWQILEGDCVAVLDAMPEASVHVVVTSPPYWGLRDYGVEGQLGLERTPEEYVEKLLQVGRAIRRVLRPDGTFWLNLGDCYCSAPPGNERPDHSGGKLLETRGRQKEARSRGQRSRALRDGRHAGKHTAIAASGPMIQPNRRSLPGLRPKDLVGVPWRVALALQADGWWLRQEIIWAKPNPMPEAVVDRPTRSHEQIFLLSRSSSYFYDRHAIMEPVTGGAHPRGSGVNPKAKAAGKDGRGGRDGAPRVRSNASFSAAISVGLTGMRNKRTVWAIGTRPFPGAHFATFPPGLVEPCIMAGSSEGGACAACGAPLERVVEQLPAGGVGSRNKVRKLRGAHGGVAEDAQRGHQGFGVPWDPSFPVTRDWALTCSCSDPRPPVPCTVLDPFAGAGTTGLVARRLGRSFVGVEISPVYAAMARDRIAGDAPLLNLSRPA